MDDEEMNEVAKKLVANIKAASVGDTMRCPSCRKDAAIRRNAHNTVWEVECTCGWSAAGSGPPAKSN
jgi:ribosomal protein L37AE/L43A